MNWKPVQPAVQAVIKALLDQSPAVYAVGGVVRDSLMDIASEETDLDLVIPDDALSTARRLADRLGWSYYPLDEARDVARIVLNAPTSHPLSCDISSLRGGSLRNDLEARDFTINAMAFALEAGGECELIDLFGGAEDIRRKRVRHVTGISLADDPLRQLRAVRFAVQLGFTIEEETELQIRRIADTIRLVSVERLRDELWKALATQRPDKVIELANRLGLLIYLFPELEATRGVAQSYPHHLDVYEHTLRVIRRAAELRDWLLQSSQAAEMADPTVCASLAPWHWKLRNHFVELLPGGHTRAGWLVWHALFHDVGKPATRTEEKKEDDTLVYRFFDHENIGARMAQERLSALRFSRQEIVLCTAVVQAHMRPHHLHSSFDARPVSRRAIHRFFRGVGGQQFEHPAGIDTLLLALADYQSIYDVVPEADWQKYQAKVAQMLGFVLDDQGVMDIRRRPLLDGHKLMTHLSITPGPQIGRILDRVLEAQAAGEVTSESEALELASAFYGEMDS